MELLQTKGRIKRKHVDMVKEDMQGVGVTEDEEDRERLHHFLWNT